MVVRRRPAYFPGLRSRMWRGLRLVGLTGTLWACTPTTTARLRLPPLTVVPQLDLSRYLGEWYEIASIPQRFQRGCVGTRATYSLRDDGRIAVTNRCFDKTFDGRQRQAQGIAQRPHAHAPGKLEVSFFRPFWGDYWVLELGPDYGHAVVAAPSRDALWILSRTPALPAPLLQQICARLRAQGFEVARLRQTPQTPAALGDTASPCP